MLETLVIGSSLFIITVVFALSVKKGHDEGLDLEEFAIKYPSIAISGVIVVAILFIVLIQGNTYPAYTIIHNFTPPMQNVTFWSENISFPRSP